jgi:hypothetical protein
VAVSLTSRLNDRITLRLILCSSKLGFGKRCFHAGRGHNRHADITSCGFIQAAETITTLCPKPPPAAASHYRAPKGQGYSFKNLHRAELSALERSAKIAEWVKLTAKQVSQLKHLPVADSLVLNNPKGFG